MAEKWSPKNIVGIAGFALAVVFAFMQFTEAAILLFILGLVLGFLNVSEKERSRFLIATIAVTVVGLVALTTAVSSFSVLDPVRLIILNLIALAGAASLVVGIAEIVGIGKD